MGEAGRVIVQLIEFARIWHLYAADRCHELTFFLIRETRQSIESANRMDSFREGGGAAIW